MADVREFLRVLENKRPGRARRRPNWQLAKKEVPASGMSSPVYC